MYSRLESIMGASCRKASLVQTFIRQHGSFQLLNTKHMMNNGETSKWDTASPRIPLTNEEACSSSFSPIQTIAHHAKRKGTEIQTHRKGSGDSPANTNMSSTPIPSKMKGSTEVTGVCGTFVHPAMPKVHPIARPQDAQPANASAVRERTG